METGEAIRLLREAGVRTHASGPDRLRSADGESIVVRNSARSLSPSDVRRELAQTPDDEVRLYVFDRISPALEQLANSDPRVALVSPDAVWFRSRRHLVSEADDSHAAPQKGPRPYGRFAVARALLSSEAPFTQSELASLIGLTQPAVSNALGVLGPLIARTREGWEPADRAALFTYAATEYPGPGGITSHWWHDAPLDEQYRIIAGATGVLLSGDLAARQIRPWRVPEHVVLYANDGIDPTELGFALGAADDYTLKLTLPADRTLETTAKAFRRPGLADPVIIARDIRRTGTTGDEDEAADLVMKAVT